MKKLIQRWLGIDQVLWNLQDMRENRLSDRKLLNEMHEDARIDRNRLTGIIATTTNIMIGVSRLIAKADAKYAESEFSVERKAESDKIGEEVLKRLGAEAKARAPYNE